MSPNEKKGSGHHDKNQDGRFRSKHVKHNPQEESARAAFGLREEQTPRDKKAGPTG